MIKTSIIIPIYNGEDYLDKCVESVLSQTQKEIEIILVDDGSTDSSAKLIDNYEKKYSFVRAIHQKNQKLGAARNVGVSLAKGKYIYFLDADDYIESTLFERCFKMTEEYNLDYVMFDAELFAIGEDVEIDAMKKESYDRVTMGMESKIFSGKQFWKKFYHRGGVYTNAYLIYLNKKFFVKNQLYFEPGIYYEDNDWILRVFQCAEKIAYLPEKLYYRRIHEGSIMTEKYSDIHMNSIIFVCEKLLRMLSEPGKYDDVDMVYTMLEKVLRRFTNIFEIYADEKRLEKVAMGIKALYYKLWEEQEKIQKENLVVGLLILSILLIIEDKIDELKQFNQKRDEWEHKRDKILVKAFEKYPLQDNISLGIYGTGETCNKFFGLYEFYVGPIKAQITYLDTYKESGAIYNKGIIYNIRDINFLNLDSVIIASFLYSDEMIDRLMKFSNRDIPFQTVPEILKSIP